VRQIENRYNFIYIIDFAGALKQIASGGEQSRIQMHFARWLEKDKRGKRGEKSCSTWRNSRLSKTEINSRVAAAAKKEFPGAELFSTRC